MTVFAKWLSYVFARPWQLTSFPFDGTGDPVLVVPPPVRCHRVLQVDTTPVNMERSRVHCCWDGAGYRGDARFHLVLSSGAIKLSQGGPKPGEEGLIRNGWFHLRVDFIHCGSIP